MQFYFLYTTNIEQMSKNLSQSRNWTFTDFELLNIKSIYDEYKDIIRYVGWGKETCPTTKRVHNQGWIQFTTKRRLNGVKNIMGTKKIHVEACRGTPDQNDNYCKKDGDFQSFGKFIRQGARTDLEYITKLITEGISLNTIALENPSAWVKYHQGFKALAAEVCRGTLSEFRHVDIEVYLGATGTGKTRKAVTDNADAYMINGFDMRWFDGYTGQKTLIIDEYSNDVKITRLLKLLDGYQLRLEQKGTFTYAKWTKVIMTTNLDIADIHPNARVAHIKALNRRVNTWIQFNEDGSQIVLDGVPM